MKKIIAIIFLTAILIIGNFALVEGSSLSKIGARGHQNQTIHHQDRPHDMSSYRAELAQMAPLQQKVRTNQSEINSQKVIAKAAYNKAKNHIQELIKNRDSLTPAQIESIKESLDVIMQDKELLSSTLGGIQKETLNLRAAKKEKQFKGISNSFNEIITVQNARINDLQKVIDDLNSAAAL